MILISKIEICTVPTRRFSTVRQLPNYFHTLSTALLGSRGHSITTYTDFEKKNDHPPTSIDKGSNNILF